jgi:transcriptional regulator with XRE-family HTH domain
MKIYADRLKQLIDDNGLTQAEFAKKIGISQSVISYYTLNKREPGISIAKKIADFFGVSVDYMIRTDEELSVNKLDSKWKSNLMNKFNKVV